MSITKTEWVKKNYDEQYFWCPFWGSRRRGQQAPIERVSRQRSWRSSRRRSYRWSREWWIEEDRCWWGRSRRRRLEHCRARRHDRRGRENARDFDASPTTMCSYSPIGDGPTKASNGALCRSWLCTRASLLVSTMDLIETPMWRRLFFASLLNHSLLIKNKQLFTVLYCIFQVTNKINTTYGQWDSNSLFVFCNYQTVWSLFGPYQCIEFDWGWNRAMGSSHSERSFSSFFVSTLSLLSSNK